jgi:hypothetical protein
MRLTELAEGSSPALPYAQTTTQAGRTFVTDLLAFQAWLLARTPRHVQAALAGGLSRAS